MIERPDPDVLLAGELGQWLTAQNAERGEVARKARKTWTTGLIVAAAVFVVLAVFGQVEWGFKIAVGAAMLGFGWAEWSKRPMLKKLKGGINGAIARALELEYSVECTPGQTFTRAKVFDMLPGYDNASFQDLWWGLVGTSPFTLHEACLTEERGSGKNRRTVCVFEGSIMSLGFNRAFTGTTVVEPNGERRKFLIGGEKETATIGGIELGRVDLVDPRFEDRFTVWSNDQVEARYLVHPEYIERLLAVEQAFAGKDIRALFHQGDLLITLKTGDLFESGSLDASEDRELLERSIAQFGALVDLAVQLNERARMRMRDR